MDPVTEFKGAPNQMTKYISGNKYDAIDTAMRFTGEEALDFEDEFHEYCPGFMYVPRKPHPFGNEYHSICDGDQGRSILWRVKLVEGKDHPKKANGEWAFPCEFKCAGISKTAALMLCMTKPIHRKGKVVTMDSGFCVAVRIIELH
mmetsp:Transcript_13459/g.28547  ORF Transcript_13459/g.28547 Transcript_13459/m.28547 type:complete len:146 (-) Transcript_13459:785-1222(-)